MAVKEWCQQLQPVQLYIMLTLTAVFFTVELVISHLTHSLTLLVDSYHMLCNIIALVGCLVTIKKLDEEDALQNAKPGASEGNLKNTFGWARIDVLVMLIGCIFLASLCFSLLVEALQTLVHIDHQDEMHFPVAVLVVAGVGLILNGVCYLLIGGYTFHQGSFLHVTASGDVILDRRVTADSLRLGQRRLSSQTKTSSLDQPQALPNRQGPREMLRDVVGCLFVVICASVVYLTSGHAFTKYLDPVISILSACTLLALSYPYMKESGLILLQTIPNDIDIQLLRRELQMEFPVIVNVHDLHVWQLTHDKVFATSHLVFQAPEDYLKIEKQLTEFFTSKGITQVTAQAEFLAPGQSLSKEDEPCLMPCRTPECRLRYCCVDDNTSKDALKSVQVESPDQVSVCSHRH